MLFYTLRCYHIREYVNILVINLSMTVGVLEMLCGQTAQQMDPGAIIDLEKVITDYAWRELKREIKWYDCMKRNCFTFDVSWNFFEFDHKTTKFQLRTGNTEGGYRERKQVELFRTDFTNNTNKDQVYKLRTQRQTKAATAVAIQRGFTLKGNTNFKLKIPPEIGHFGVSASADGYLRVCRPRGETFEDTFTWQVDSDVTVEPNHVTNAKLLVNEDELVADFEVRTLMRMPTGEAPIVVRRKNNKDIYAVMMISDLRDVFADIDCKVVNIGKPETSRKSADDSRRHLSQSQTRYAIEFITNGIIESVRWRNQKICLESHPIRETTHSASSQTSPTAKPTYQDENSVYASSFLGKILEHAISDTDELFRETERVDVERGAKAKKDLRFNIIPTVISEPEEDPYETPEKLLSTLIRESASITGSPQRLSGSRPVSSHKQFEDQEIRELSYEPHIFGASSEASKPIIIMQRPVNESPKRLPAYTNVKEQYDPREITKENYSTEDEPPSYKSVNVLELGYKHHEPSSSSSVLQQYSLPTHKQTQPLPNQPQLHRQEEEEDHQYKSQVEHFYLRSGQPTEGIGFRHVPRDMTQIVEEPEKESAASISKQSSVQSEETIDDATESLDSGDSSRRISKVTSV